MSFTENPFQNVRITISASDKLVRWACSSCGAEGPWVKDDATVRAVVDAYRMHVRKSHKRTPADFQGWH